MVREASGTAEIMRTLKRIDTRLKILEEALGVSYDEEGIIDPEVVKELLKREKGEFVSEEEFWREVGVED